MELEEIGKILLAVLLLAILIFGIWLLVKGKGGDALNAIKNLLRFGK
jgi:ABC-type branched-subunit amino acid transport system permease subunit